jgi:phosphomannomutase
LTLIKSIAGIRGTIGGSPGETLSPLDVVRYAGAFGEILKIKFKNPKVVIGRDARPSGPMIGALLSSTLIAQGIDVIDTGLSTTPTVEMAIVAEQAQGGIVITASHNPIGWNALKLLSDAGEFISAELGAEVLKRAEAGDYTFAESKNIGKIISSEVTIIDHIDKILQLTLVDVPSIKAKKFKVILDAVNSTGGIAIPLLLEKLGVEVVQINGEPTGLFAHNPEPLPENIGQICKEIENGKFDLGIVVDPDVDRLALVSENGEPFGEEYTLVAVSDYVLSKAPGNTVSNLSSTRALKVVTEKHKGIYHPAAVGEVNVVAKMKEVAAVIGGEGNGGIIYPELHYGRDALVGIALFLSHLAQFGRPSSILRAQYPNYFISKNKIDLTPEINIDTILETLKNKYAKHPINTIDGLKIEFDNDWIHLRKSNTEPIIRIFAESESLVTADHLANKIISDIKEIITD